MPPEPSADLCDLVRRAQAGDQEAAQKVHDQCREPLLSAIRYVLKRGRNSIVRRIDDSTDFLQDAFLQIFTRAFDEKVLQSPDRLLAYLRKIAQNKVRNECKRRLATRRFRIDRETAFTKDEHQIAAEDLSPHDAAMLCEFAADWVEEEVEELPLVWRAVATLVLEGRPVEEIARQLETSIAGAEDLVRQTRRSIERRTDARNPP